MAGRARVRAALTLRVNGGPAWPVLTDLLIGARRVGGLFLVSWAHLRDHGRKQAKGAGAAAGHADAPRSGEFQRAVGAPPGYGYSDGLPQRQRAEGSRGSRDVNRPAVLVDDRPTYLVVGENCSVGHVGWGDRGSS